ncbi:MAG: radical SAM protein [Myxococcota bacterium]
MKRDDFLFLFIDALRRRGIQIDYLFSYNNQIKIGFSKGIILTVDFRIDGRLSYYKILSTTGYQYRAERNIKDIGIFVERTIQLIHPYVETLRALGQTLFIKNGFRFKPQTIQELFPFLSYEEKADESELLVRFTNRCNQGCEFCSAPIDYIDPEMGVLKKLIDNLYQGNNFQITLTGGEPTIRKEFVPFLGWLVKNTKNSLIRIQTNAVAFSNRALISKLPKTRRIQFFISLHSLEEEIYDKITSSKGQFDRAIKGIKNILDGGYDVIANVVLNRYNYDRMDDYLKKFYRLFGNRVSLHFSVLILPEYRINLEKYIVSYREILRHLLPLIKEYKIPIDSLISSTHASIPLCYFPPEMVRGIKKRYRGNPVETGYEDLSKNWVKKKSCLGCRYDKFCIGVPKNYFIKFGVE